jgi:hypothetical protein
MPRLSARSVWLQSIVCLAVLVGVIAGDISVAQARVATNHKRAALRKLHRAEAAYVAQVDAISRDLFVTVQPVQNALDQVDATRPQYIHGARDAIANSATTAAVKAIAARLAKLRPTATMAVQHKALQSAIKDMTTHLATLEKVKKAKDPADLLDEPYSGATLNLSIAEDDWQKAVAGLDAATHRVQAPSPGSAGSARPRAALPASKASWIFGADHACYAAGHAMYLLPEPSTNMSLSALARLEDRYAGFIDRVNSDLRRLKLPARDRTYLQRGVYKSLHANDVLAQAEHEVASGARKSDLNLLNDAQRKFTIANKGLATLSHAMTAYGATFCGVFFDPHAKPTTTNGGSSTITA